MDADRYDGTVAGGRIRHRPGEQVLVVGSAADPTDWEQDLQSGLGVIEGRSEALARFMGAYARLARLPSPTMGTVNVRQWTYQVIALEDRAEIVVVDGPEIQIAADGDQLDQLLINLLRNATGAAMETNGRVSVGWRASNGAVEVCVEDEGPGCPTLATSSCLSSPQRRMAPESVWC